MDHSTFDLPIYEAFSSPKLHHQNFLADVAEQKLNQRIIKEEVSQEVSNVIKSSAGVSKAIARQVYLDDLTRRLDLSWSAGLRKDGRNLVSKSEVLFMLDCVKNVLQTEKTVLRLELKVEFDETLTVVGDTHGQFYDLLNIFKLNGKPNSKNKYLFNGDYVDRGSFSFQVIFLLLGYKALFPENVFLLRGNHETEEMNIKYGFFDEIMAKYDIQVMDAFWDVFSHLPLAASLSTTRFPKFKTLIMHGGISDRISIRELDKISRKDILVESKREYVNPKHFRMVMDLLWSDPMKNTGKRKNRARGVGIQFGPDVTKRFLENNGFDLLIRSHQVRQKGWSLDHSGRCMTVFSCPNYCDSNRNKGAYLKFSKMSATPERFEFSAVKHPKVRIMAYSRL